VPAEEGQWQIGLLVEVFLVNQIGLLAAERAAQFI